MVKLVVELNFYIPAYLLGFYSYLRDYAFMGASRPSSIPIGNIIFLYIVKQKQANISQIS